MVSFHAFLLGSFYFVLAVLPLKTCKQQATATNDSQISITKISYSSTGGKSGNYEKLAITADSLQYIQARRGNEQLLNEKTGTEFWRQLTKAVRLNAFDRIKSNPGHALYDGIDFTIEIETKDKLHTLVNGHEDSVNYQKIAPFTTLLEEKLAALGKKIVW